MSVFLGVLVFQKLSAASFNICAAKVDTENKVDVERQVIDQAKIKIGYRWHNLLLFGPQES